MGKSSRTSRRSERRASKTRQTRIIIGVVLAVAILGPLTALLLSNNEPAAAGEPIPIVANAQEHVEDGTVVEYNSDPPTSGPHYAVPQSPGFYDEVIPDGHIVHSMEHGYIIVWYDCDQLSADDCETLKKDIQNFVSGRAKTIGLPRSGMETPIALTSWGRLLRLDEWDANAAREFHRANLNKAPEPNAM